MAIDDAYALADEYKGRVGKPGTSDDEELNEQLKSVSRYLDLKLGRHFSRDDNPVTRTVNGNGRQHLWLPFDIATDEGLDLKVDLNADYTAETTLVKDTDFWLGPDDADKKPEPFPWEAIEVHPSSSEISVWPEQRKAIVITAVTGWPAVPGAIKEATISLTRILRDLQQSGFTLTLQNIEQAVQQSPEGSMLLKRLTEVYGRGPGQGTA